MCANCSLRDRLFARGILIDSGVDGLYARSGLFEDVIAGIDRVISSFGGGGAEVIRFPPAMSRAQFEHSGYMQGFPQLAGTVHSFAGNERDHAALLNRLEHHQNWTDGQTATDVVLAPAACYPLYPIVARRGPVPADGGLYDVQSYCFRHEPSTDPTRMQMFRMREYVRIGDAAQVLEFRRTWLERGRLLIGQLALPCEVDLANDPFFGRAGKMLANNQRDQGLKFELLVPIENAERPTACLSFNYHQDHFGSTWGITIADGATAHSACVGFGMERIALALFTHHGLEPANWPQTVRAALAL